MKTFVLSLTLLLAGYVLSAQPFFALHHSGNINYYKSFLEAFDNSVNNDTIYVPGGTYAIGTLIIDRTLCIYGVGYYPDSCVATTPSELIGGFIIKSGADNGVLSGLFLNGSVVFGTDQWTQTVNNYTITRCRIASNLYLSYNGSFVTDSENITIHESVVQGNFFGGYAKSTFVEKSFFRMRSGNIGIKYFINSVFSNNIFTYDILSYNITYTNYSNISDCIFENNIIIFPNIFYSNTVNNNTFLNNLFQQNVAFPINGNSGSGNIVNQSPTTIFTDGPVPVDPYSYSLTANYAIRLGCPGRLAGTDGFDVGIFGTEFPLKHVPVNPHISFKNIGFKLNENNELDVKVRVDAQDR